MSNQKTLQQIMTSVKASTGVPEPRRRVILSALNTAARCIGRDPGDIIATPAALQKELGAANYRLARVKKKRWTNVRSLVLEALRISGAKIAPSRHVQCDYPEEWKVLRRALPSSTFFIGMSRFMGFCARNSILPDQVDSTVFDSFRRELLENSLVRNAPHVFSRTCHLWDRAGNTVPGWPDYRTAIEPAKRSYSLDWSAYPLSLKDDVEAFLNRKANPDIFASDYAPAVRKATTHGRRKVLRQMATALVEAGLKAEDVTSLAQFVQPENAKAILLFFIKRRDGKTSEAVYSHACLLKVIAQTWVGNVSDFGTLEKLGQNVRKDLRTGGKRRGMKQRNIDRLRQFEDRRNRDAILGLPSRLMRQAARLETGIADAATLALYAAAIEILTVTAIRVNNLTGLKIKENLIMPSDPQGQAVIFVPGEDVKNGNPIEIKLPATSTALLLKYLKDFRPNLSEAPSPWLFPNRSGQRRNTEGFSACISDVIYRHTGLVMHAHLFRHFALMMLERARPGSAEIGRRFLGHSHIQTTLNSYAQNGTAEAHKLFENVIESHRANLRLDLGAQR